MTTNFLHLSFPHLLVFLPRFVHSFEGSSLILLILHYRNVHLYFSEASTSPFEELLHLKRPQKLLLNFLDLLLLVLWNAVEFFRNDRLFGGNDCLVLRLLISMKRCLLTSEKLIGEVFLDLSRSLLRSDFCVRRVDYTFLTPVKTIRCFTGLIKSWLRLLLLRLLWLLRLFHWSCSWLHLGDILLRKDFRTVTITVLILIGFQAIDLVSEVLSQIFVEVCKLLQFTLQFFDSFVLISFISQIFEERRLLLFDLLHFLVKHFLVNPRLRDWALWTWRLPRWRLAVWLPILSSFYKLFFLLRSSESMLLVDLDGLHSCVYSLSMLLFCFFSTLFRMRHSSRIRYIVSFWFILAKRVKRLQQSFTSFIVIHTFVYLLLQELEVSFSVLSFSELLLFWLLHELQ